MEATELRIGNFICTIAPCGVVDVKIVDADILYIAATRCNDLQPIPLTEEWLLKFGFEYRNGYGYRLNGFDFIVIKVADDIGFHFNYYSFHVEIKHVHHLQNLYYAVKEKELTLK